MRVLLTGAAGSIGRVLSVGLADRGHEVVAVDLLPAPDGHDGPWHTADCTDPDAIHDVFAAAGKLDAVVHLAGLPTEASLPDSLTGHVLTTGVLLDAMLAHDVSRFVYASSNHAVGRTPRTDLLGVDVAPRPDTFYGVSKIASEALMRLYVDRYGLDAVSCRIGSFTERPETTRALSTWLSHDDCVRMVDAAVATPAPGFAVLYGISANTRRWWDLEPGRLLGYSPVDDAEEFAASVPQSDDDEANSAYVGGPFALEGFYRPAVDRA
ncbi:MAG: NAD(P)-dependent oxidoreductase [Nocardioides sp.]